MTDFASRLCETLLSRRQVQDAFADVHARLAIHLVPALEASHSTSDAPDWGAVLSWAAVMAQSKRGRHVEHAITCAVAALLTPGGDGPRTKEAARVILETAGNFLSAQLAQREFSIKDPEAARAFHLLYHHRARLRHMIATDEGKAIPVTPFQEEAWEALMSPSGTAISAPTSSGKSFILGQWIRQVAQRGGGNALAYIVPSRALVSQVASDLARLMTATHTSARIVTIPALFSLSADRRSVAVMTQERVSRLLAAYPDISFDLLVVDEAQKLSDGARGVVLQSVMDEISSRGSGCKVVVAAPHAEDPCVISLQQPVFV